MEKQYGDTVSEFALANVNVVVSNCSAESFFREYYEIIDKPLFHIRFLVDEKKDLELQFERDGIRPLHVTIKNSKRFLLPERVASDS